RLRLPLTMQWNVTFEQSLGSKRSFSASYVGAVGRRLLRLELENNPNPDFGQVFVTTNGASSSYHALQLQFQRRLSRSLQSHIAYTWSHSIDNASNDSFANSPSQSLTRVSIELHPTSTCATRLLELLLTTFLPR